MRKNKQKQELELARFEQNMLIFNPDMYREYIKQKEEDINSGNANVTWIAPETDDEAREIANVFSEIDKQLKSSNTDTAADEEFVKQVELMRMFNGIDIEEIGGEE